MGKPNVFTDKRAKKIGDRIGVNWKKIPLREFRMGLDVEMEHGLITPCTNVTYDEENMTGMIALAHLNERPDYYTNLHKYVDPGEGKFKYKAS